MKTEKSGWWLSSDLRKIAGLSEQATIARVDRLATALADRFGRPLPVCRRAAKALHNDGKVQVSTVLDRSRALGNLTYDLIGEALTEACE